MKGKRSNVDFSEHVFNVISKSDNHYIFKFAKPQTNTYSITFVNACGILAVTGGVEIFQKDILGGLLSDGYIDKCDKCYSFQYFLKDFGCMDCQGDVCWHEVVESILNGKSWVIGNIYESDVDNLLK